MGTCRMHSIRVYDLCLSVCGSHEGQELEHKFDSCACKFFQQRPSMLGGCPKARASGRTHYERVLQVCSWWYPQKSQVHTKNEYRRRYLFDGVVTRFTPRPRPTFPTKYVSQRGTLEFPPVDPRVQ